MGNDLIALDRKARRELEQLLTDGNTAQKIAKRARIVLMTADGHGVVAIMREVGVSKTTVWRWQDYFAEAGVDGLIKGRSKPPGRKPLSAAMKLKVIEKTVKERPANATHWSVRSMAEEMGISHTSVQRIWAEHGLKPHLVRSFKISNDPDFVAKVEDIVGLYVDPPEKALVLSVDEKRYHGEVDSDRHFGRVRLLPPTLEATMQTVADRPEAPTAIRTDLGAIFVSLELSRSTWLITSLSPGGGEKMSKQVVRGGDVAGLLERFARLREKARARTGKVFPFVVIQEAGLDGFWIADRKPRRGSGLDRDIKLDHISRFVARHARGRLIQQQDLGIGGERHADLERALLGIGEITGHVVAPVLQPQLFEVLVDPAAPPTQGRNRTEQGEPVTVVAHDGDAQVLGYAHAG